MQTLSQAQAIADTLLASVKGAAKGYRRLVGGGGNPALLGDRGDRQGQGLSRDRQEIDWAGCIVGKIDRKKSIVR